MLPFRTVRSTLSVLLAAWFAACSFPDYRLEPPADPLASVCTDGKTSDAETGLDCGGGCPPCGMGQPCRTVADCASMACDNGTCQLPTCSDGVRNGAEADTDCGGQCPACDPGRDCRSDEDCAEKVCADAFCQVPTCSDGVRNGNESDADCGGPCEPCVNGSVCGEDGDCESQHCSDAVCVAADCTDGAQSTGETDVDCGGAQCGPCSSGKKCLLGSDCTSLICGDDQRCTAYSCDDDVLNGEETATDCGGPSCGGCQTLEKCDDGADCESGACQSSLCVPAAPTGEPLSRQGWSAKASDSYPDHTPSQVLDSSGGRWTSGIPQYDGLWFEVDMQELRTFFTVQLRCEEAPLDIPGKFDFYLSTDGKYEVVTRPGLFGKTVTEIHFDTAQVARYLKFVLRESKTKWLSIDEIAVLE